MLNFLQNVKMHQINRRLLVAAVLFWVPIVIFAYIANEVVERQPLVFDTGIQNYVHGLATPTLDSVVKLVTNLGGIVFILPAAVVVVGSLIKLKKFQYAKYMTIVIGGATALNVVLKLLFQRNRPTLWDTIVTEQGFSFPSGHAMASSAIAFGLIIFFWHTKWRWLAVGIGTIYIAVIGLSRVYLGVHYPTDIIAGWCISFAWAIIVYKVMFRQIQHEATDQKNY